MEWHGTTVMLRRALCLTLVFMVVVSGQQDGRVELISWTPKSCITSVCMGFAPSLGATVTEAAIMSPQLSWRGLSVRGL